MRWIKSLYTYLERSRIQTLKIKKFIVRRKFNLHALIDFGYLIHKKKDEKKKKSEVEYIVLAVCYVDNFDLFDFYSFY